MRKIPAKLTIATRRSKLALAQSHWIKSQLEALEPGLEVVLREYVTRGDRIQNVPLNEVGGKGLFTKEIEDALLAGEADLAVHSLKDLPSELPPGLTLAAVPVREDPRDALVLPAGPPASEAADRASLDPGACGTSAAGELKGLPLPLGTRVGTSSLRRMAQLRYLRPDLVLESVRGNVDTRLRKLDEGQYGALLLAAAGLRRLGLAERISLPLPVEISIPAPGQGALGLEARAEDAATLGLLARLADPETHTCVRAERALMDAVGGGCSVPLGSYARILGDRLELLGVLAAPDGSRLVREQLTGPASDPEGLGNSLAARLLGEGGREILESLTR